MSSKVTLYNSESTILKRWEDKKINIKVSKLGHTPFRFIDGPPFVSGKLHTGSLSVGFIKDAVLRYMRMHGYYCNNKIGFDCHGLPSENMVMKLLGLNSRKDIEEYGVDNFIKKCIETINQYSLSWKPSYDKIGRIVDFNDQYKTIDTPFMETVWWIFKEMWKKELIYKAYKIMPHSYACETALSNFEAGENYKDICTKTLYVKFQLKDQEKYPNTYLVCWTTTAWTLPSNVAVCVSPKIEYVKCHCENGDIYITSKNSVKNLKTKFVKIEPFGVGSDLKGLEYLPLYNFMEFKYHKVLVDDYVQESADIGTSLVHLAASHGEEDCRVCLENNVITSDKLDLTCLVNDQGKFIKNTDFLEGVLVFDASKKIIADLNSRNLVVLTQDYTHSYPHCYRTDTPLIYKITSSYFVAVSKIKDKLVEMNDKINWVNPGIKTRFKNWIENPKDWCISRNRYFGTPIPVWESEDGTESIAVGSIQELIELANLDYTPKDLHLNNVKDIEIISRESGKKLKVVGQSVDCWFESGSVPYGQIHYPFENSNAFDDQEYLCDFIAEGLDQTRGWFYTLLVISTIISNKPAFKNVICNGLILGRDGKKESKKNNNFVDPDVRIEEYGADSIRLYILSSSLINGEPLKFLDKFSNNKNNNDNNDNKNNEDVLKFYCNLLVQLKNAYNYFLEQKETLKRENKKLNIRYLTCPENLSNPTDLWILTKLFELKNIVETNMNSFNVDKAVLPVIDFVEDIANWYIKLNRDRMKGNETENEQEISLSVLFTVLFDYVILLSPFAPFTTDELYSKLVNDFIFEGDKVNQEIFNNLQLEQSVHMCSYPKIERKWMENSKSFENLKEIVFAVRNLRGQTKSHSSLRVPIKKCKLCHTNKEYLDNVKSLIQLVENEVNALEFEYSILTSDMVMFEPVINHKEIGRTFKKDGEKIKEEINKLSQESLKLFNDLGFLMINGNKITTQYLTVNEKLKISSNPSEKTYSNNNLLMILDLNVDEDVNELGNYRNIVFNIQQARKKMGLKPWDKIEVFYNGYENFMGKMADIFEKKLKCSVKKYNNNKNDYQFIYKYIDFKENKEETEIEFYLCLA
jgi:isoleucyl-tRNA synthetase